jgi:hypothetical protein
MNKRGASYLCRPTMQAQGHSHIRIQFRKMVAPYWEELTDKTPADTKVLAWQRVELASQ